jgi:hypothetical protein
MLLNAGYRLTCVEHDSAVEEHRALLRIHCLSAQFVGSHVDKWQVTADVLKSTENTQITLAC